MIRFSTYCLCVAGGAALVSLSLIPFSHTLGEWCWDIGFMLAAFFAFLTGITDEDF